MAHPFKAPRFAKFLNHAYSAFTGTAPSHSGACAVANTGRPSPPNRIFSPNRARIGLAICGYFKHLPGRHQTRTGGNSTLQRPNRRLQSGRRRWRQVATRPFTFALTGTGSERARQLLARRRVRNCQDRAPIAILLPPPLHDRLASPRVAFLRNRPHVQTIDAEVTEG